MEYTPFDYFINGRGLEAYSEHNEDICFVTKAGEYSSTLNNMEPGHISVLKENWHHFDPKQHVEQVHPIGPREETGVLINCTKYFWPIRRLEHGLYQVDVKFDCLPARVQVEVHKNQTSEFYGTFNMPEIYNGRCSMKIRTTEQFRDTWYVIFYAEDRERREIDYELAILVPGQPLVMHPNSFSVGRIEE